MEKKFKKPSNSDDSEFYNNLKPLFILDFLLSTLPLSVSKKGSLPVFKVISWSMLYSIVTYTMWMTLIVMHITYRSGTVDWNFDGRMAFYRGILMLSLQPFIPILHWMTASQLAQYFRNWQEFEVKFSQAAGGLKLSLKIKKLTVTLAILIPISTTILTAFHTVKLQGFPLWFSPVYWKAIVNGFLLNALWYSMFKALNISAAELNNQFRAAISIKNVRQGSSYHVIEEYRYLWLQLLKLVKETGDVSYTAYMLHWFLLCGILILSSYGLLVNITNPGGNANLAVNYLLEAIICFIQCFIITEVPHHTIKQVKDEVQAELEKVLWNEDLSGKARDEVVIFLQTIEMNHPVVTLGKFFSVNRSLLTSLLSTLMTYLIVLIQFRMGASSASSDQRNATTVTPANDTETS